MSEGCLKGLIFMMNKKSIRKYLKSFEEGVFIPDTTRGGEREINIIRRAISVATMQVIIHLYYINIVSQSLCTRMIICDT